MYLSDPLVFIGDLFPTEELDDISREIEKQTKREKKKKRKIQLILSDFIIKVYILSYDEDDSIFYVYSFS